MVVTEKLNGKLRVCIDPKHLNKALKRSHYPLPVIEDILPELTDVKVFSKADLKDGFLQIQLDEESSKLTTFQTPWGRYRYLRMPFGISPAPECFQRKLDQNLEGLNGVYKIADDILITGRGSTMNEAVNDHDDNLLKLLDRCRERNLKLNRGKLQLKCPETPFIGHVLTPEGVKPDPSKVAAILKMEPPKNIAAVRRLVGLANYLSKFLSKLSELCELLRRLTHKDVEWRWSVEQEEAFQNLKYAVTSAPVLKYFSSTEPVEGQGGASSSGIGFVLMQSGQPVSYASRDLTASEKNYSQIEKELLAQAFGVERNHQFFYGRRIVLWSDHKPLETICKKPLAISPKRLQRLLLRLPQYDVEIRYKPGPEMHLADTLSRVYLPTDDQSPAEAEVERINAVDFLPISEPQLLEIQRVTAADPVLQSLIQVILKGWPDRKENVPTELYPYFNVRDEITAHDGVLFKGLRCLIPINLRPMIRERLHGADTGIESCLRRAREAVYWPGMTAEIKDHIAKCTVCAAYQKEQPKEPLISHKTPYPQSNGKVESAIKTAKSLLKKSKAARSDIHLALLEWTNTPSEGLESFPAQRMFGRRTRTLIPTTSELLKPKIVEDVPRKLLKRKQLQAKYYNISAHELPPLSKGEVVRVKPTDRSGQWYKALVEQQVDVRSYDVRTEDGRVFRRNRRHLRSSREPQANNSKPLPTNMPAIAPPAPIAPVESAPAKTSNPQEVLLPKENAEATLPGKTNTSAKPALVPVPSAQVMRASLPVTRSVRISRPPGHLKDFVVIK